MLDVSSIGVGESDEEIELSLELSIGGSYGKCEKLKPVEDSVSFCNNEERGVVARCGFSISERECVSGSEAVVPNRKREIQALRRREAIRKREEQLRKAAVNIRGMIDVNDKVCLEGQQLLGRAQDREMREKESLLDDHQSAHKEKNVASCSIITNEAVKESNLTLKNDETAFQKHVSDAKAAVSCQQNVGMAKMRGLYPRVQCVPLKNGSVDPYGVPCLGPDGIIGNQENEEEEKTMFQPLSCGSFKPYLNEIGNGDTNMRHSGTGSDSGPNCGLSRIINQKAVSNGSLERSSSSVSDYRSTSEKGGSTSDTGSHSCCLQVTDQRLSISTNSNAFLNQPESNCSFNRREASLPDKMFLSRESQYCMVGATGNSTQDTKSNMVTSKLEDTTSSPLFTEVAYNPSKIQSQNYGLQSLPQMPCVSTTGNGPNGKTITGFLYKYTKSDVSIICVCHGSSFSAAEFVEHAGGIDITHPLRHITMIPFSLG